MLCYYLNNNVMSDTHYNIAQEKYVINQQR